jgi:predicted permease
MNDLKFAFRQLLKNPGFTCVAVWTLALGIGANTAIFSFVNAIMFRSLPVPNPHALRLIKWSGADWQSKPEMRLPSGRNHNGYVLANAVSLQVFHSLREQCGAQADIFAYSPIFEGCTFRSRHEPIRANGLLVSGNFFSGLGVPPLMGRLLGPDDERAGAAPAVVISHRLWEHQFDFDPNAVGQVIRIGPCSFTVVGVLSREFPGVRPGVETEFYAPLSTYEQLQWKLDADSWCVALMGRLRAGITDAQCQSALNVVFAQEAAGLMENPRVWMVAGRTGADEDRNQYGRSLWLLWGVVVLVLLVACANLTGLMLARGAARQQELAVRAALGASRGRLVRQSLTESLLLACLGGGLGLVIANWSKAAIGRLLAASPDGLHFDTSLDLSVLSFAVISSLGTAVVTGTWPAFRAARLDPLGALKDRITTGTPRLRAGRFLVAAQIALSLLLVGGAGLFVRTLVNLTHIDNTGYAMDHLLVFKLQPGPESFTRNQGQQDNSQSAFDLFDRIQQSLAAIPGVQSAAFSAWPAGNYGFQVPGDTPASQVHANVSFVSESFFATMRVPLLVGREPRAFPEGVRPKTVVVNERFVRKYLSGRKPIGLMIKLWGKEDLEIVGVCRDAKYMDMDFRREATPMVHFASRQIHPRFARFVLRTTLPPLAVTASARKSVAAIDPNIPLINISTQEQVRNSAISSERTFAMLCGSLALLAVLLSGIGLYGLMACHVACRTREIGIRQALGATRRQIAGPILREALMLAGIGIVIGAPLTLALARSIRSSFYGVGPADPITFGAATILFLGVALLAAWVPARRAATADPMEALRHE